MNGPFNEEEEAAVWERPWSLDEIGRSGHNWSLGADAGLLNFLREFSQQTISRTHEIEKQLDGLIRETKATDCRVHNVFNDFLMLSNTQFIENRVYDEEVEEHVARPDPSDKPEQEKSREQKEAELIPKIQEAVNYGLQVLESAFEQLDIKAGNSDSEDEEVNGRVELILEPKDLYIDRPLPCLIGSQLFMLQEDVGLGDVSSEEGSVDNDCGSIIDSEEEDKENEESDDDFGNSEDDKKMRLALSDEDDDNGSDLFGDSDKEEDDEEGAEKPLKTRTKSFADELAERIQSDVPKKPIQDQLSVSSLEVKSKKETKKLPSDDEEDDIFKPPKLTDDDFSPFGSKGHLFSGGRGLFDDDGEGDLFADSPKKEVRQVEVAPTVHSATEPLPSKVKKKPPIGGVSLFPGGEDLIGSSILADKEKPKRLTPTLETAPKLPTSTSLFDDEDGLFGSSTVQPASKPSVKVKPASDLFDEDDFFEDKPALPPLINKAKETETAKEKSTDKKVQTTREKSKLPEPTAKKHSRGLFSDEDDSETDLFSPSQSVGKSKASLPATKPNRAISLFDDEDEEDLFGSVREKKPPTVTVKSIPPIALPAETKVQRSGLFSSDEEDPASISNPQKTVEHTPTTSDVPPVAKEKNLEFQKTSLFEDEEDELFAITKESQKKNQRVSLLFEEDNNNEGSFFAPKVNPVTPVGEDSVPSLMSVPVKAIGEHESLFEKTGKKEEQKAPISVLKEPGNISETLKQVIGPEEGEHDDLFAASPPAEKHTRVKSKTVLSLFENEEEEAVEDQPTINIQHKSSGKVPSEKSSHVKSTGVFQDEELLFSQELQKDNDPDVDLFASTKKQPVIPCSSLRFQSEKHRPAKPAAAVGLFGDEDDDDLFSTAKPKKPPKVQEKKPVIKRDTSDAPKEVNNVPEVKVKKDVAEKPAGPAPIKTKSPSSRIGKLQANLLINPASILPGAVPKLPGARLVIPGHGFSTPDGADPRPSPLESKSVSEGVSFEKPAQIDTLHSANKTRAKVGGNRRPPTRMGRKLVSQASDKEDGLGWSQSVPPSGNTKFEAGSLQSNLEISRDETISTMKLSLSENDIPSNPKTKAVKKSLTPDVKDLFGSEDLFAKGPTTKSLVTKTIEPSSDNGFTSKPTAEIVKKSPTLTLNEEGSDDDLFQVVKPKIKKALKPSSAIEDEPERDLFGSQKVEVKSVPTKDTKSTTNDSFEDDIFAAESTKPVKKTKEKKQTPELNLFDDHLDIFADLTQTSKDKKSKKKVEPKSIFDDDMDDIFSSGNVKKTKPTVKQSQPAAEVKPDSNASNAFDDPLNVFGN
ncbi:WASH complex subunit 2A-like [Pelodytes ibericus]